MFSCDSFDSSFLRLEAKFDFYLRNYDSLKLKVRRAKWVRLAEILTRTSVSNIKNFQRKAFICSVDFLLSKEVLLRVHLLRAEWLSVARIMLPS